MKYLLNADLGPGAVLGIRYTVLRSLPPGRFYSTGVTQKINKSSKLLYAKIEKNIKEYTGSYDGEECYREMGVGPETMKRGFEEYGTNHTKSWDRVGSSEFGMIQEWRSGQCGWRTGEGKDMKWERLAGAISRRGS